jgi:hypothetical protein
MNKLNRSIPLAFLLAVAADTSGAPLDEANGAAPVLTHGMLAELLAHNGNSPTAEADGRPRLEQRMAQFRNYGFFNCFGGNWRNC